jgi:hypothetical protein
MKKKENETKEERNARRAAKKQKKLALKAKEKELFGYSDEANPFGDQNLTQVLHMTCYMTSHKCNTGTKHYLIG